MINQNQPFLKSQITPRNTGS